MEDPAFNQRVSGSNPDGLTNKTNNLGEEPRKSPTGSPTRYYLEAWGKSWRIVDIRRGWGLLDTVCICARYEDAVMLLDLLQGKRA